MKTLSAERGRDNDGREKVSERDEGGKRERGVKWVNCKDIYKMLSVTASYL